MRQLGAPAAVLILDCDEAVMKQNMTSRGSSSDDVITRRIAAYKEDTLAVLRHYDALDLLTVVCLCA